MVETTEPRPEMLKLFRKKHSPLLIALAALAVLGAIALAAYLIYQATLPPNLPEPLPPR